MRRKAGGGGVHGTSTACSADALKGVYWGSAATGPVASRFITGQVLRPNGGVAMP